MAYTVTYFCTPALVKESSFIHQNVEDTIVKVGMKLVQDLYFEKIFGTPLYNKIIALIEAGTISGTDYETLMDDYVLPCYFSYCAYELAPHVNTEIRNKAVGKSGDSDISPATETELEYLRNQLRGQAQKYEARLIGHLCDSVEADTYPEYSDYDADKKEQVSPQKKTYLKTSFV